jgi:hypothetical protein
MSSLLGHFSTIFRLLMLGRENLFCQIETTLNRFPASAIDSILLLSRMLCLCYELPQL